MESSSAELGLIAKLKKRLSGSSSRAILFLWFFAIAFVGGQLAVLLALLESIWADSSCIAVIAAQAANGNFITFSTALLVSSLYFLLKEYLRGKIDQPKKKMLLALVAIGLILLGAWVAGKLADPPIRPLDGTRFVIHWAVYFLSTMLSFYLWVLEDTESTPKIAQELADVAGAITADSSAKDQTSTGLKV